jgi:hypothetical protein
MKKYLKLLALLIITPMTQAEYTVTIDIEKNNINFKNHVQIEWIDTDPSYTEWKDISYGSCAKWIPAATTELAGVQLTQKSTSCTRNQERYKQEKQKDKNSDLTKNVGEPILEKQTLNGAATRTITATGFIQQGTGPKTCAEFAMNYGYGYWIQYPDGSYAGMYYGATSKDVSYPTVSIETLSSVVKGYIISRGDFHQPSGSYLYYKVCKQKL